MKVYIVVFELRIRGVYTCSSDAHLRTKELGGGEVSVRPLNCDVD